MGQKKPHETAITMLDRYKKIELIQRSLGIKHKLRVYESMKAPDNHEDLAVTMLTKWELEDELKAIEEILTAARANNIAQKRAVLEREGPVFGARETVPRVKVSE